VHRNGTADEAGIAALRDHRQLALVAVLEDARHLLHRARLQPQPALVTVSQRTQKKIY
jgi:hypothetical protein